MSERAVELLNLPDRPCYILDIGCGSGLSGEVLTRLGHVWVGLDISTSMLGLSSPKLDLTCSMTFNIAAGVAKARGVEGDLCYTDVGHGMFFRPGTFDGCIRWSSTAVRRGPNH